MNPWHVYYDYSMTANITLTQHAGANNDVMEFDVLNPTDRLYAASALKSLSSGQ